MHEIHNRISETLNPYCKIKLASPDASDVILNRIKPYKAENPFIWSLNRLSNTDKHRLLIPTINQAYFSGIPIEHKYHSDTFRGSVTIPRSIAIEFTGNVSGAIIDDTPAQMKIKSPTTPVHSDTLQRNSNSWDSRI